MANENTATPASANLYEPCKECKKKRTVCVRVRRPPWYNPKDFGHANISVHEPLADGTTATTTYGNWPGTGPGGTSVRKNYAGDDYTKDKRFNPKDVKCKEMTEEEEKKLQDAIAKPQKYDYFDNNCSNWAGSTWNGTTGDSLNYGANTNYIYNSPTTLGNSLQP